MARIRPSVAFAALVVAAVGVLTGLTDLGMRPALAGAGYPAGGVRPQAPGEGDGVVQTPYGPLGPADRDLLVKVRQAGLWEMPMGQLAQTRGGTELVREAGGVLAGDHMDLDMKVRTIAAQLGVPLPDQPNADQQGWMAEIRAATGADFDRIWVNRLRAAHGKVFIVVSQVRSGTRNTLVREMAQTAIKAVQRHMTVLEDTGLVDYAALPTAPAPAPAAGSAGAAPPAAGQIRTGAFGPMKSATLFLIIVVVLVIATTLALDRDRPGKSTARSRLKAFFTVTENPRDGSTRHNRGQHHE